MGKHLDALPKLEDWKSPWEEKGEDFDPEKGRGLFHFYLRKEAEAKDALEDEKKTSAALQAKIDEAARANESESEKAKREHEAAIEAARKEGESSASVEALKLRVALRKGLNETQAKRLVGTTEEELVKDADDLLESFGGAGDAGDGGDGGETPNTRPQRRLRSAGDPGDGDKPFDPDKAADAYVGSGMGF